MCMHPVPVALADAVFGLVPVRCSETSTVCFSQGLCAADIQLQSLAIYI